MSATVSSAISVGLCVSGSFRFFKKLKGETLRCSAATFVTYKGLGRSVRVEGKHCGLIQWKGRPDMWLGLR